MATGTIKVSGDLTTVDKICEYNSGGMRGFELWFSNGHSFRMVVGKLNASANYAQFWIDTIDKGYITFTVSRNIG